MVSLLVVVPAIVGVRVRHFNLLRVGMIVGALDDHVVLSRSRHSEVLRVVLAVLVMVSVILVAMNIFGGHVMVQRVLIMMRVVHDWVVHAQMC